MTLAAKIDDYGKLAWIGLMVLGFVVFWPVGLVILTYLIWSGRMKCSRHGGAGRWRNLKAKRGPFGPEGWFSDKERETASGNHAFDEYRAQTLRRLEDEQGAFHDYLEHLRHAKDKAEFDQFMTERRRATSGPEDPSGASPQTPDGPPPPPGDRPPPAAKPHHGPPGVRPMPFGSE